MSKHKQLRTALSQLASIVECAHDAIIGMTLDGIILSWNPSAERVFSYSAEEVKGRPISILIPPERSPMKFRRFLRGSSARKRSSIMKRCGGGKMGRQSMFP